MEDSFPVLSFLKQLKLELPYNSATVLLGIYWKKTKTLVQKDICIPMFTAALLTIAKMWKQPKWLGKPSLCRTSEWTINVPTTETTLVLATVDSGGTYMWELGQVRVSAAPQCPQSPET